MIQLKNIKFLLLLSFTWAQFETPVTLSVVEKEPVRAGEVATIIVNAEMDDEWRSYALRNQGKGPVASKVTVSGRVVDEIGMVLEEEPDVKYDDAFETTTRTHHGGTSFEAPFLIKNKIPAGKHNVEVAVLYQVCNATLCYPPNEENLVTAVNIVCLLYTYPIQRERG